MDKQVWERLQGESVKAHAAFLVFADLPPDERSVNAAYRAKSGRESVKVAPGYWFQWSRDFDWERRASALDQWRREQLLLAETEAVQSQRMAELERERVRTLNQSIAGSNAAVQMLNLAVDAIKDAKPADLKPSQLGSLLVAIMTVFEKSAALSDRALLIENLVTALQDRLEGTP